MSLSLQISRNISLSHSLPLPPLNYIYTLTCSSSCGMAVVNIPFLDQGSHRTWQTSVLSLFSIFYRQPCLITSCAARMHLHMKFGYWPLVLHWGSDYLGKYRAFFILVMRGLSPFSSLHLCLASIEKLNLLNSRNPSPPPSIITHNFSMTFIVFLYVPHSPTKIYLFVFEYHYKSLVGLGTSPSRSLGLFVPPFLTTWFYLL